MTGKRRHLRDGRHAPACLKRRLYWLWAVAEARGGRIARESFGPAIDGRAAVIQQGIEAPYRLFPCAFLERRGLVRAAAWRRAA